MPIPEMMTPMIVMLSISGFFLLLVIGLIIYTVKYRRHFKWSFRSHEIVLEIAGGTARLFVDGRLDDQFAAQRTRAFTLRTVVDGVEIKVFVNVPGAFRFKVSATANGEPLTLVYAGK